MSWTPDDVERWLNDFPLPKDLRFRGEIVWPRYALKKGYGFWLRTSGPYHVAFRGLFNLVVQIIQAVPVGKPMPNEEQLATLIRAHEAAQGVLVFTAEDNAKPEAENPAVDPKARPAPLDTAFGQGVDFARRNREREAAKQAAQTPPDTTDNDTPEF